MQLGDDVCCPDAARVIHDANARADPNPRVVRGPVPSLLVATLRPAGPFGHLGVLMLRAGRVVRPGLLGVHLQSEQGCDIAFIQHFGRGRR